MCSKAAGIAAVLLLLAGCATAPAPPEPAYPDITLRIVPTIDDEVIEIRSVGPRAIAAAVLHVPGMADVTAYSIDTEGDPSGRIGQSVNFGNSIGASGPDTGAFSETDTLVGQIASVAMIRINHPADFSASWRRATVEVTLGNGRDTRVQVFPAPGPG